MASNSIADLIGGKDDDSLNVPDESGAIRGPDEIEGIIIDDTEKFDPSEPENDPLQELWLQDFELANNIKAYVSMGKLIFITFMYVFWYLLGFRLKSYYNFTWLSAFLAIWVSDGPLVYSWYQMNIVKDPRAYEWFFYTSLTSTFGPLIGYFVPLTALVFAYDDRGDTGVNYTSPVHFWMGWWIGVSFTLLCIIFDFAFLPIIRVWYDNYEPPEIPVIEVEEEEQLPEDIEEEVTEETEVVIVDDVVDPNTTFFRNFLSSFAL